MAPTIKKAGLTAAIVLLLTAHAFLGRQAIRELSPTFDEPVHLVAGTIYLKTALYRYLGLDSPPFAEMWAALPLLFTKAELPTDDPLWKAQLWRSTEQYPFANIFLYQNRLSADQLMRAGRSMQLALSILFGLFLAWFAYSEAGAAAAVIATGFWAFSPTTLAHGTLITTDLAFAGFFFMFFALAKNFDSVKRIFAAGLVFGLCIASKYFCLAFIPVVLGLGFWQALDRYVTKKNGGSPQPITKHHAQSRFLVFCIGVIVLILVYQFTKLSLFERGMRYAIKRGHTGHETFLMGRVSLTGFPLYFPFTFVAKSTIPLLISLMISAFFAIRKKVFFPSRLVIPPLIFFALMCVSKKQIGHRYILPVYPFLYFMAAVGLSKLTEKARAIPAVLIAALAIETWRVRPHYLSYFNPLVGGSSQGYRYLTDSNVDWGQALPFLRKELTGDDINNGIYLAYFGVADPHYYGIRYVNMLPGGLTPMPDDSASVELHPTKLALSVTHYQNQMINKDAPLNWLSGIKPDKLIGNAIFLYDFSNNPQALEKLQARRVFLSRL